MMTDLPPTGAFEEDASTPPSPSSNSSFIVATKMEPTPIQRVLGCDAFSYYSNKFNLMKTLLLQDDNVEVLPSAGITFQGPAAKRRKGTSAQPIQDGGFRQTRISFEVHPSLLLDDDFLDMLGEMPYVNISDDESEESDEKMKTADDEEDEKQEKKSKITLSAIRSLFLHDYDNDDDEEELSGDTVASSSLSTTFTLIPTGASLNPTDEQEIDLRDMDEQDLKSLQKNGEL
jgi:hypothetical protein